ncbi:MAG: KEOPS complex subunit Pcc1 [Nitrososphaerota archaeon]|nr:KEOPS complex subunit Pcc1 [Nitrososphaerota archaeon]
MKANAVIRLKMPSKESLDIVYEALAPETAKPATTRSRAKLEIEDGFLVLMVEAKDTVALRAALNAYLRWIASLCDVVSVLDSLS